jgi:hypothetical protein
MQLPSIHPSSKATFQVSGTYINRRISTEELNIITKQKLKQQSK